MTAKRIGPNLATTFAGKIWSNHICCHFLPITKEMTAERIGPNFSRTVAGKVWSNPLCCHFIAVAEDMTAERIEPNLARTLAGKTWSNPVCCHFLEVSICVLYLSSFLTFDKPPNKRGRSIMNNSGLNSRALDNLPISDLGPSL